MSAQLPYRKYHIECDTSRVNGEVEAKHIIGQLANLKIISSALFFMPNCFLPLPHTKTFSNASKLIFSSNEIVKQQKPQPKSVTLSLSLSPLTSTFLHDSCHCLDFHNCVWSNFNPFTHTLLIPFLERRSQFQLQLQLALFSHSFTLPEPSQFLYLHQIYIVIY